MSIDRLVREGGIHPFRATREEIAKVMDIAKRDLDDAEKTRGTSLDWTYSIAYNSVKQACRAYMFHMGYRPASSAAHKATFEFMQIAVDEPLKKTIDYFDRVRKKLEIPENYKGAGISESAYLGRLESLIAECADFPSFTFNPRKAAAQELKSLFIACYQDDYSVI